MSKYIYSVLVPEVVEVIVDYTYTIKSDKKLDKKELKKIIKAGMFDDVEQTELW